MLRYVTEVCKPDMLLPARVALTKKQIPLLLELINASQLQPRISKILELLLPSSRLLPDHPMFGIWIGTQHQASAAPILKIYCNLLQQLGDPWSMFHDTLRLLDLTDVEKEIVEIRKSLGAYCWPSFIGLECSADGLGQIKLYLRSHHLSWSRIHGFLQGLGWVGFEPTFVRLHNVLLSGRETYHPHSMMFCIIVPKKRSEPYGIKVEFGPRYYMKDDEGAYKRIVELAHELMLNATPYEQMIDVLSEGKLTSGSMRFHDVIGLGFNPQNGPRLNIYLRPDLLHFYIGQ